MKKRSALINKFWKWPDGWVWRVTHASTERFRRKRFELFMRVMRPTEHDRVLDVGVGEGDGRSVNFFEAWYPWKSQITVEALEDLPKFRKTFPEIQFMIADGKRLPLADQSFDIVFSNAVIEHVGSLDEQQKFLAELCRVGKRVFFSTPNRWFPLDAHTMIPFAHWLPRSIRHVIYRLLGRGYYASDEHLRLLSRRELRTSIPTHTTAQFFPQRFLGLVSHWSIKLIAKR